jgi:hypothetical protein
VASAELDNIFWNKFEETLFSWLMRTNFLEIFSYRRLIELILDTDRPTAHLANFWNFNNLIC